MVSKIFRISIFLFFLTNISCNDSIVEPETLEYFQLLVFANDSVRIDFDSRVIYEGIINCQVYSCFKKELSSKVGTHTIIFRDLSNSKVFENIFFLEDSTAVEITYYKPENSSTEVYDFRTYNRILP